MRRRYVALLRGISNLSMRPFRERLEALGFVDVDSYGMAGDLLFTANSADTAALERRLEGAFGTAAFVRTRSELARAVSQDPFGSSILFLKRVPSAARRRALLNLEFAKERPLLHGRVVYFKYPASLRGQQTPFDFERVLGVRGTARSARVVTGIVARMAPAEPLGAASRSATGS